MRVAITIGWAVSIAALAAMVIGHFGDHDLNWRSNQISTYAALAPLDSLVTSSMMLSAAALAVLGVLSSRHGLFGTGIAVHVVPLLAGAAAAGLVMLALYEESATTLTVLREAGFQAIRQQSFHDAGLQIFFYGALLLVMVMGGLIAMSGATWMEKLSGLLILCLAPGSFLLMSAAWPSAFGIEGPARGLQQRASLLCLWLAMAAVLAVASKRSFREARRI